MHVLPAFQPRHWVRAGLAMLLLSSLSLSACNDDDDNQPDPTTTYGDTVTIGNGSARSFITTSPDGAPTEVGMRITEAGLTGLPTTDTNPPAWYMLPLPATAAKIPFNHVSFDWNPHGHDPAQIYDSPHFDVHFYTMPMNERMQIAPNDPKGEIAPESKYIPTGYVAGPGVVPMMGKHWINPAGHEFHGEQFTQTLIYGSYNGNVTFIEPMITLAYLQSKTTETFDLPQPQAVAQTGLYYPTKYTIGYDAAAKEYTVKLHNMVLR
ncbi:DUF5602 domain-containing protein [Hymenobacter tenuis]